MRIAIIIVIASVLHDVLRLLPSLFACNAVASLAVAAAMTTDEFGDYNGIDLIEWIRSHPEGVIHPSLRIGRERLGDSTSMNGLFVSSDTNASIQKGEVIARIPCAGMFMYWAASAGTYWPFRLRTIRVLSFFLPCPYWQNAITGTSVTPVSVLV